MGWRDKIPGAFANAVAPFTSHPLGQAGAWDLLTALKADDAAWPEVAMTFHDYMQTLNVIDKQMVHVDRHFRPWCRAAGNLDEPWKRPAVISDPRDEDTRSHIFAVLGSTRHYSADRAVHLIRSTF